MVLNVLLFTVITISLYTDLRYNIIPNWLLIPAAFIALIYQLLNGGAPELWISIKGMLLGLGLLLIPFILGGMGAGDVKLLGFIGACGGPGFVWLTFLATALAGGLLALVILIKEKKLLSSLKAVWYTLISLFGATPRVNMLGTLEAGGTTTFPYGVAITAGTLMAYLMR
jgi:prepilin peptidase CpaA